jgi:8-oxo-dGTP diphosphatase
MAADGEPSYELMDDVRAVDWLPLDVALERLSRGHERAFLANVGPLALKAAATARPSRWPKAKPSTAEKRRTRPAAARRPLPAKPESAPPPPDLPAVIGRDEPPAVVSDVVETRTGVDAIEMVTAPEFVEVDAATPAVAPPSDHDDEATTAQGPRRNLIQKMRDWLRRAA